MISYAPFWETLKKKNISTYKLLHEYGLSHGTYDNLRHNRNVNLSTIDQLCKILHCKIEDVVEFIDE